MARFCFSWMPSGHKYAPLIDDPDGPVFRLYCPRCGRVIPADQRFNTAMWSSIELPAEVETEAGGPREPVH